VVVGAAEVVGATDETDAEDDPDGGAGGVAGVLEQPASRRATNTRTLRTPLRMPDHRLHPVELHGQVASAHVKQGGSR
jgi:hypothetical protein